MIKFNKLLFIGFLLFITSCSKDDDSSTEISKIDKSVNLRDLGDSAHELLSDAKFTSMNIEVVYVNGFRPSDAALLHFKNFLEERTYKPDGIKIGLRAVNSSNNAPFDIDEIVTIEANERSVYNAGDEISVFIYYADGSNENDKDNKFVLGSAFRNTSMVIYGKTINEFANRFNAPSKDVIEAAVLEHEFGHLFGLVDIGTEAQTNHIDPDSEGHCSTEHCLMRATLQFGTGVINILEGGSVPTLGDACIRDLQANGGK